MIYTYTTMRPIVAGMYTSREQNILIKEYLEKLSYTFSIPYPEFVFPRCYIQLYNIYHQASQKSTLIIFSISQLYELESEMQNTLITLLSKFDDIHFALEEIILKSTDSWEKLKSSIEHVSYKT